MSDIYAFIKGKIVLKDDGSGLPRRGADVGIERLLVNSGFVDKEERDGDIWGEIQDGAELPAGYSEHDRRGLWPLFDEKAFFRAGKAFHLMEWQRTHRYCGVCGARTLFDDKELAMRCPVCGELAFPVIAPAVIVAVEKDGKLLMGHGAAFPPGRFSVLAGFVEPGETLEQCVEREVYEESKIRVKNIRYFASQPWPFPRSLMAGFTAEWAGGEIEPDMTEVTEIRWFAADELPDYFRGLSISCRLIEDFIRRHS